MVTGEKTFRLGIPDDAKVTFGPWSPGKADYRDGGKGTLRVYQGSKENIIGCFSGVASFRDITAMEYAEVVAKEEGATIWKDDERGYTRETKVSQQREWVEDVDLLPAPKVVEKGKRK